MTDEHTEELWRGFPKTLPAFEKRFPDDEACHEYLAFLRWNGQPCCSKCGHDKVWPIKGRALYECAKYSCQMSLNRRDGISRHAQAPEALVPCDF